MCERTPGCGVVSATWSSIAWSVIVCGVIQLAAVNVIDGTDHCSCRLDGVMVTGALGWLSRRIVYEDVRPPSATWCSGIEVTVTPGVSLSRIETSAVGMVSVPEA